MTGHHLIKYYTERINIAAIIQGMPPYLFRGGIIQTTYQRLCHGNLLVPWSACKSKIHHLNLAPSIQHQILRLNIAVNHVALFISGIQGIRNLSRVLRCQVLRHHAIDLQQASYGWPLHIFHHKIEHASLLPCVIDLHNIWMIQPRDNLCFSNKTCHVGGIFS